MVTLHSLSSFTTSSMFFFRPQPWPLPSYLTPFPQSKFNPFPPTFPHLHRFTITSVQSDSFDSQNSPPRTLFPGGYKRPEIKLPNIVLLVTPEDVINNGPGLDFIDTAVTNRLRIVVVNAGDGSGGKLLYEAACLLKSVIRDRAFLLVAERVDIAAAVNASGVLLSDQGLPPIVARNALMGSKPESVILPLVGRMVRTVDIAISASNSEGADFVILSPLVEEMNDIGWETINQNIKIPVFCELTNNDRSFNEVRKILMSGGSGPVLTLEELEYGNDALGNLVYDTSLASDKKQLAVSRFSELNNIKNGFAGETRISSFVKLENNESQFIKKERCLLVAAVDVIEKAAPLMEEISLLKEAISQLDDPFLLVIVGEFNSGKSTFINALLGGKFLKDGVIPTTNEITFLRYSEFETEEKQYCERHPDGRYMCYLPSQILKKMIIVDTPGTNVILQRQQRLTEEFVPRADLLLFVLSADRPLSESEVAFLQYTQQWNKIVVFLLNKADMYRNSSELDEASTFVRQSLQKLLNVEDVKLFPISARSALEAKLAANDVNYNLGDFLGSETNSNFHSFTEFEDFLNDFLDGSTSAGLERMKIKLETPIAIAGRLLFSCQTLVMQDYRQAKKYLISVKELMGTVKDYAQRIESESISWRRQVSSLVEGAKLRAIKLVEFTLQLSNLDLAFSLISKGDKQASFPATQSVWNDMLTPALSDAERLLVDYTTWLNKNYVREMNLYRETFEKSWPSIGDSLNQVEFTAKYLVKEVDGQSIKSIKKYNGTAASRLFDQEIRKVFLGAFGGLGAAGLSASLLTSVLPTTLEDLLALGFCSAGGLLAISNFPARRQKLVDKVKKIADVVGQELEEAMHKDVLETVSNLEHFVAEIGTPYEGAAQQRLDHLLDTRGQLTDVEKKLQTLQVELQNLHLS